MMLVTSTLSPPTWAAMLPQKFSAATTSTLPLDACGVLLRPQLDRATITAAAGQIDLTSASIAVAQVTCASDLRNLVSWSGAKAEPGARRPRAGLRGPRPPGVVARGAGRAGALQDRGGGLFDRLPSDRRARGQGRGPAHRPRRRPVPLRGAP